MEYQISPEAIEEQALRQFIAFAKEFYSDPKNVEAFEAWLKENGEETEQ